MIKTRVLEVDLNEVRKPGTQQVASRLETPPVQGERVRVFAPQVSGSDGICHERIGIAELSAKREPLELVFVFGPILQSLRTVIDIKLST